MATYVTPGAFAAVLATCARKAPRSGLCEVGRIKQHNDRVLHLRSSAHPGGEEPRRRAASAATTSWHERRRGGTGTAQGQEAEGAVGYGSARTVTK